jgi:hypothetical protein
MRNPTIVQLLTASLGEEQNAGQLLDQLAQPLLSVARYARSGGIFLRRARAKGTIAIARSLVNVRRRVRIALPCHSSGRKAPPSAAGLSFVGLSFHSFVPNRKTAAGRRLAYRFRLNLVKKEAILNAKTLLALCHCPSVGVLMRKGRGRTDPPRRLCGIFEYAHCLRRQPRMGLLAARPS